MARKTIQQQQQQWQRLCHAMAAASSMTTRWRCSIMRRSRHMATWALRAAQRWRLQILQQQRQLLGMAWG
jgi:hypothetical protein